MSLERRRAMDEASLTDALEREHHEIDAGLEALIAGIETGQDVTAQLDRVASALRRHIFLEERFLFPPLRSSGLLAPVLVMLREHGDIWRTLDALEQDMVGQDGPGATKRCHELLVLLEAHNAKEEPIIYPEGDARLSNEAKEELRAFIQHGTMPDDWVCAMATSR